MRESAVRASGSGLVVALEGRHEGFGHALLSGLSTGVKQGSGFRATAISREWPSIFYCEAALGFLESCSIEDESYFAALIRMYGQSIGFVSLPLAERTTSSVLTSVGYAGGTSEGRSKKNSIAFWYAATLKQHRGE
jgi:hypothetical protein